MSIVLGGSLSTFIFGSLAALASAVKATSTTAIVEPSVFRIFADMGAPYLVAKTYDDIVLDDESAVSLELDAEKPSYLAGGLIRSSKLSDPMKDLSGSIGGPVLTREEGRIISLALGSHHDRLILWRREAREFAKALGLNPSPPLAVVLEAYQKGVIDGEEFVRLFYSLMNKIETGDGQ